MALPSDEPGATGPARSTLSWPFPPDFVAPLQDLTKIVWRIRVRVAMVLAGCRVMPPAPQVLHPPRPVE